MNDLLLITKYGDHSSRKMSKLFDQEGVAYRRIMLNTTDKERIKVILESVVERMDGDLDELLTNNVYKDYGEDYINDLKLSEFINLVSENPIMLRTPLVLNKNNKVIIGYDTTYTIDYYIGRRGYREYKYTISDD